MPALRVPTLDFAPESQLAHCLELSLALAPERQLAHCLQSCVLARGCSLLRAVLCTLRAAHAAQVLVQLYERGEEPLLIGMYRKELAGELCAIRRAQLSKSRHAEARHRDSRRHPLEPRVGVSDGRDV